MEKMWDGFTDFELITLAYQYGLQEEVQTWIWNEDFTLFNRKELEELLTAVELESAFGA